MTSLPRKLALTECDSRPQACAWDRKRAAVIRVGLVSLLIGACGGETRPHGKPDQGGPAPATGGAGEYGSGTGEYGSGTGGAAVYGSGTGGAESFSVNSSVKAAADGGASSRVTAHAGASGSAPLWDGYSLVHLQQSTQCASAGRPIEVEIRVGAAGATLNVVGTRTVAAESGNQPCLPNFVDDACVVAEPFAVTLDGASAQQVLAAFSYMPHAECIKLENVSCEMPCNTVVLEIDGVSYGANDCCGGHFDPPAFPERVEAAVLSLMQVVAASLPP